jgi:hypothetical protein
VAFTLGERDVVLDLQLNKDLLPQGYFEKYHHKVRSKCSGMRCKYVRLGWVPEMELLDIRHRVFCSLLLEDFKEKTLLWF